MQLPDEVSQWLLSRNGLQECAGLSLQQRLDILNVRFDCHISIMTLHRFYKRNGIKFGKAKLVYSQAMLDFNALEQQRREYARQLGELISDGAPLIYVDETTFNTWLRKTHSW